MDKLIVSFLIRAKQATYAGKGAETASSRVKSHDLIYRNGDYMYYDTYLGGDKFAGEEALWISDVPYWSMNHVQRDLMDAMDALNRMTIPEGSPYTRSTH